MSSDVVERLFWAFEPRQPFTSADVVAYADALADLDPGLVWDVVDYIVRTRSWRPTAEEVRALAYELDNGELPAPKYDSEHSMAAHMSVTVDAHKRFQRRRVDRGRSTRTSSRLRALRVRSREVRRIAPRSRARRTSRTSRGSPSRLSGDDPDPAPPLGGYSRQTATKLRYAASSRSSFRSHSPQTGRLCSPSRSSSSQAAQQSSSGSTVRSASTPSEATPRRRR